MRDEMMDLMDEYDGLLAQLNAGALSINEASRIQAIEDQIARQYGYDWMQQYLMGASNG